MLKFKRMSLFGWILCISCSAFSQETKIIAFNQVLNLNVDQSYQFELENLNPSTQLWTAFYVVGVPQSAGTDTQANLTIIGDGLIAADHPKTPIESITLIANNLPVRQNYSLKEFSGLVDEIEVQTGQKVQDPNFSQTGNVRVYGRILDWIPEYNLQKPAKISFSVSNPKYFDIKAIYMIVGEGAKTSQLLELAIENKEIAKQPPQTSSESKENDSFPLAMKSLFLLIFVALISFLVIARRKKA